MKSNLYLSFFALLFSTTIIAQPSGWNMALTGSGSTSTGNSIARDADGNVYVAGTFDFPSATIGNARVYSNGGKDIFLIKYNAQGEVVWAHNAGDLSDDEANGVATDANGNIFVTGTFNGPSITFGQTTIQGSGTSNFFIAKYDSSGNVLWANTSTSGGKVSAGQCITTDGDGNAYMAGTFIGPKFTIGTKEMPFVKYYIGIFIAKYNANGNIGWVEWADGPGIDQPAGIATDNDGNVYLCGHYTSGGIDFSSGFLLSSLYRGGSSVFMAKYSNTGSLTWARTSNGQARGTGICISPTNDIYASGYLTGDSLRVGTNTIYGKGNVFLGKYNTNGTGVSVTGSTGGGAGYPVSISVGTNGNVYLAGRFSGNTIGFGNTTLTKNGTTDAANTDMFVTASDVTGNMLWAHSAGGNKTEQLNAVVAGDGNEAYVTGSANSASFTAGNLPLTCDTTQVFIGKIGTPADAPNGITETKNISISIYPNPSTGSFNVSLPTAATQVEVLNMVGQTIQTHPVKAQTNFPLNITASGVYFVRVTAGKSSVVEKIVVL